MSRNRPAGRSRRVDFPLPDEAGPSTWGADMRAVQRMDVRPGTEFKFHEGAQSWCLALDNEHTAMLLASNHRGPEGVCYHVYVPDGLISFTYSDVYVYIAS